MFEFTAGVGEGVRAAGGGDVGDCKIFAVHIPFIQVAFLRSLVYSLITEMFTERSSSCLEIG